jgi:hypothetical protein
MAFTHFAVLLGTALFALVAALQLLTSFGAFDLGHAVVTPLAQVEHMLGDAFESSDILKKKATSGQQYLLGVGKADITG